MRRLAWAALLPLAGLLELGAHAWITARAVEPEDWAVVRAPVEGMHRPGDVVVVAPAWAEPHARRVLGDARFGLAQVARSGVDTAPRALEIGLRGARSEEVAGFREIGRREVGPFVVRELENPAPQHVVFDFTDALGPERATVHGAEPRELCRWDPRARAITGGLGGHPTFPRARFTCPSGEFFGVGETVIADERFRPRRCVWAHPPRAGERVIRYERVPLGDRVVIDHGMYWMIERNLAGAPIEIEVRVDGDPIGRLVHVDGDGWSRGELALGAHARAASATVEFAVRSRDVAHRHYCFRADTR